MRLEFISLQSHNPVDDAKEELKEDISNLRQEVMVGFVLQCIVIGRALITLFYKYIYPLTSFHILTQKVAVCSLGGIYVNLITMAVGTCHKVNMTMCANPFLAV